MWERYCRGVNAIVYMVDAADQDKIEVPQCHHCHHHHQYPNHHHHCPHDDQRQASRNELHNLLERPQLAGIPILVTFS